MEKGMKQRIGGRRNEAKRRRGNRKKSIGILCETFVVFLFAAVCAVLEIFCITFVKSGFVARHERLLIALSVGVTAGCFIAAALFSFFGKSVLYRSFVSLFALALFVSVVLFVLQ